MADFSSADGLAAMVRRYNAANPHIPYDPSAPTGKTVAEIFEFVAEPHLIRPTFIYDFPLAISPLSKNKRESYSSDARERVENADWVERFEIFVGGLEIGNAFSELNDPEEQRRRFEQASSANAPAATKRPTRWTRTTSVPSPTACLQPQVKEWVSTASPCCSQIRAPYATSFSSPCFVH